jgi:hypothetical protein
MSSIERRLLSNNWMAFAMLFASEGRQVVTDWKIGHLNRQSTWSNNDLPWAITIYSHYWAIQWTQKVVGFSFEALVVSIFLIYVPNIVSQYEMIECLWMLSKRIKQHVWLKFLWRSILLPRSSKLQWCPRDC